MCSNRAVCHRSRSAQGIRRRIGLLTCAAVAALVTVGLSASAASAASGPTVSPATSPQGVGTTLTATPAASGATITWMSCNASGTSGTGDLGSGTTYQLALSDLGTDVCASEPGLLGSLTPEYSNVVAVAGVGAGAAPSVTGAGQPVAQGQTLTVTHGAWGSGATTSDVWEDCGVGGGDCTAIAGAKGSSYTVARTDAGHSIAVLETATDAGHTASATSAPTGVASATAPVAMTPPAVSGVTAVGQTLTASPGDWTNDPTGYAYSWARCAGSSCTVIPGATAPTYRPTADDVGDSLEVRVVASVLSSASSAIASAPTDIVNGSSSSTGTAPVGGGRSGRVLGRLLVTMQWSFRYTPSFTQILGLQVDEPSFDSEITIDCTGRGCPYKQRRRAIAEPRRCRTAAHHKGCRPPRTIDLRRSFGRRHLRVGARVTVTITRTHYVGKYYRFVVRARRGPSVFISCLAPGASRPGKACPAP